MKFVIKKLKYILENNDFNEEVNNLARSYYDSLDNDGCKRIVYKQTCDKTDIMQIRLV